jgi:hypothetical protein
MLDERVLALVPLAVQGSRLPVAHSSNSTRQGSSQSLGRVDGASHGELDLLVDLAGQAPGLILGPHEVRFLIAALRGTVPSQSWCVSECFDRAGEQQHGSIGNLHPRRLRSQIRGPSPPRSPHTRWQAWPCRRRESPVLREGQAVLLPGRHHPHRQGRYAHTRQSLVGRTEQDPTNQHQPAATTALHPRLQRAVSPSCHQSDATHRQHHPHMPLSERTPTMPPSARSCGIQGVLGGPGPGRTTPKVGSGARTGATVEDAARPLWRPVGLHGHKQ